MNRKEILALVKENCDALANSEKNFAAIYKVMFRLSDNVLAESNDGFRIHKITYKEAKDRIEKVAAALYAKVGATHGYIGLEMENCIEWIICFWAILRSGNRPYLVNCRHPKELSSGIVKSLAIKTVIALKEGELPADYLTYDQLDGKELAPLSEEIFENELALSTSATSLKEVVCFYSGKEFSAQLLNTQGILKKNRRVSQFYHNELKQLAFLPFYHIFGLVAVYFWFTYFGRTIVFLKDYAPDTILQTIRKHEVTHIFAVPMFWHTIEKQILKQLSGEDERTQKKFWKGIAICTRLQNVFPYWGAKLSRKILHRVTDRLFGPSVLFCISGGSYLKESALRLLNGMGYALHNGYGMSEIGITSVELRDKPKDRNRNAVGEPFGSVEYRIAEDGTLEVRGDSLCYAIMTNGERTENTGWFNTKDIMVKGEDGAYYIRGRMSDTVIGENGENINPDMVEQCFHLQDALNYSVLGLPCEDAGEELSFIAQVSPYLSAGKLAALTKEIYAVNETLPMAGRIRRFYFTEDNLAPETAIKVGRQYVLRGIKAGSIRLIPFGDYHSDRKEGELNPAIAEKVRKIVCANMDVTLEELTDDAHLMYDLGASSLQYFAMVQQLSEEFGLTAYNREEQYCYTVRTITEYIEKNL